MEVITRDIRGIPIWLLRDYLVDLGGVAEPDGRVVGLGWTAELTRLDDFQIGSLRVGQARLELRGEAAAVSQIERDLQPKLLRAGG